MTKAELKLTGVKEKAQEEFSEMMDKHVARYSEAVKNKKLTIDMVEAFMGEAMREGERIIKEIASDAMKAAEADLLEKKNNVHTVLEK